tara:strand:+ start:233 stop:823 length:591 start_codon:yes stop_codon:yes gene_type:complete
MRKVYPGKGINYRLNKCSIDVCHVREPGGTDISEEIRSVLLSNRDSEMAGRCEALLMSASRAQLTKNIIIPSLKNGKWVIADRYSDSTLAYQGGGRGIDFKSLIELNHFATYGIQPDISFFIDIEAEEGFNRRKHLPSDRIENAGVDFQNEIRNKYFEIIDYFKDRYICIDGNLDIDTISNKIWKEIRKKTGVKDF